MNYNASHMAVREDGSEVKPGDTVTDFRNEEHTFRMISRVPGDGTATTGKVIVDSWNWSGRELYAHVFDLTIKPRTVSGDPASA